MNHRIFERILRPRLRTRACMPQRRVNPRNTHPVVSANCGPGRPDQFSLVGSAEEERLTHGPVMGLSWVGNSLLNALAGGLWTVQCWPKPGNSSRSQYNPFSRPELMQEHPLNLSISISGGKETNKDSPSNGERSGNSPT